MISVPVMNNRLYDALKYVAQILLPALGALYFGLAQIWNLPEPDKVVGSVVVIDTFLGALLKLSKDAYDNSEQKYDGAIEVTDTETKLAYSLNLKGDPEKLAEKNEVTFKIDKVKKKAPRKRAKPTVQLED